MMGKRLTKIPLLVLLPVFFVSSAYGQGSVFESWRLVGEQGPWAIVLGRETKTERKDGLDYRGRPAGTGVMYTSQGIQPEPDVQTYEMKDVRLERTEDGYKVLFNEERIQKKPEIVYRYCNTGSDGIGGVNNEFYRAEDNRNVTYAHEIVFRNGSKRVDYSRRKIENTGNLNHLSSYITVLAGDNKRQLIDLANDFLVHHNASEADTAIINPEVHCKGYPDGKITVSSRAEVLDVFTIGPGCETPAQSSNCFRWTDQLSANPSWSAPICTYGYNTGLSIRVVRTLNNNNEPELRLRATDAYGTVYLDQAVNDLPRIQRGYNLNSSYVDEDGIVRYSCRDGGWQDMPIPVVNGDDDSNRLVCDFQRDDFGDLEYNCGRCPAGAGDVITLTSGSLSAAVGTLISKNRAAGAALAAIISGSVKLGTDWVNNEFCDGTTDITSRISAQKNTKENLAIAKTPSIDNHINVFPNPSNDAVTIVMSIEKGERITVELYDLQGKNALRQTYTTNEALLNKTLDISQLPKGIYVMDLKGSSGKSYGRRKIVKE